MDNKYLSYKNNKILSYPHKDHPKVLVYECRVYME